ncbi:sulfotransferase 1A3-like [Daphnia carinata]|uniref:sulfotransferase 1A3-like n=1 Tax=Daphnia carinata TaxID=120202 RepID=UPI00286961DA|nr:sulfotransferase 1A3-like [Daphnia carinata]
MRLAYMDVQETLAAAFAIVRRKKKRYNSIVFIVRTSVPHRPAKMSGAKERLQLQEKFDLMPETLGGQFRKDFPPYIDGLVRSVPHRYVTTPEYAKNAEDIYNLAPRPDDIYVSTFPKCGTTWVQELVWMVVNQCDFEKGKKEQLSIRSPFLEMNYMLPMKLAEKFEKEAICRKANSPLVDKIMELLCYWNLMDWLRPFIRKAISLVMGDCLRDLDQIDQMAGPRVIKSHLPLYLLNPTVLNTSKVVYVARNPKDVIVSYYHYHRLLEFHHYTGNLEAFADYFMTDRVYSAPFFPHLLDAWNKRHHPNLHFVFYEDLKRNLRGEIEKIAKFLGKPLTEDQLAKLTEHLRFDNFAKNETVNCEIGKEIGLMNNSGHFIRKGKTGDWKNHFSPELNERIDKWMQANLEGTDLRFITELEQQD